jgi:hypothetical protein
MHLANIPISQQIIALLYSLTLLLVTIQLIRKHKLREQYALVWLGATTIIFILAISDGLVTMMASFFHVTYAPTLILVLGLLFSLTILLSQSVTISSQADHIRDLAQDMSMLEWDLQKLQAKLAEIDQTKLHERAHEQS